MKNNQVTKSQGLKVTKSVCLCVMVTLCFLSLTTSAWAADEPSNYNSGISMLFSGIRGTDWDEEVFWYNPVEDDHKVVYIKSGTIITMQHNVRNMRQTNLSDPMFIYDIGPNGEDGVANSGDEGVIRYKLDQALQDGYVWSLDKNASERYPAYSGPFNFAQLTYATGIVDEFGDAWHSFSFADDDEWLWAGSSGPFGADGWKDSYYQKFASDGKIILFVINPKTPCVSFSALNDSAQFYTTPAKACWIPKVHSQTTYLTGDVEIKLTNIMGGDIYYRFDSNAFQKYTGPTNSNVLSDGNHILEYYYNGQYHKIRKIVKNPGYPSKDEVHGYLLWKKDADFQGIKERVKSSDPARAIYKDWYNTLKDSSHNDFNIGLGQGKRIGSGNALQNSFIALADGINNSPEFASWAKKMLLDNVRKVDPLWFGDASDTPNPCPEVNYRGYYDVNVIFSNAFAYDLLIAYYRRDQYSAGITPIEDYKIRDSLAAFALEAMMQLGDYGSYFSRWSLSGMWGTAREIGALTIALALPSYNTPYFGTSGFDGAAANYSYTPYPDHPVTWKQAFFTEDNLIYGYPNFAHRFGLNEMITTQVTDRKVDRDLGTIDPAAVPAGSFNNRPGYYSWTMMGHCFNILSNVMKNKLDYGYSFLELSYDYADKGELYAVQVASLDEVGPRYYPQICLINENFPSLAGGIHDSMAVKDPTDIESLARQMTHTGVYSLIFYRDNWEEILNGNPVAKFNANPIGGPAPLEVQFDASDSRDYDGSITKYEWDFGDGPSGSGVSVEHIYQNNGDYTAKLTVTDNEEKQATYEYKIVVNKDITADLVLRLPFDSNSNDYSLYAKTAYWSDNLGEYGTGKINQAGVFNGSRYVSLSSYPEHEGMSQLTLMAWVKPTALSGDRDIISKANEAYRLRLNSSGQIWYYLKNESGQAQSKTTSAAVVSNEWNYIVLTYDGANVKVYLNGALVYGPLAFNGNINQPGNNLFIGTYTGSSENFIGLIDDVRIYNRALSDSEILNAYNTSEDILYGDVDDSGEISAYDAALTAQAAVGLITLTAEQTQAADVSGEGEVSAYDAALIAQRAVGLITKFPVEE